MRLWTLHPRYLDVRGLTALWRETLLAQRVLLGGTRGYRHHPQLDRFRAQSAPTAAIAAYLWAVHAEACRRGYRFNADKIHAADPGAALPRIDATAGQLAYEWRQLQARLRRRAPQWADRYADVTLPEPHPLFHIVPGPIADWERPHAE